MEILKINEYSYSYAEYTVTDGIHEIRCVCNSVPLPNQLTPKIGMKVKKLYAFCYNQCPTVKKVNEQEYFLIKTENVGFQYNVIANIFNKGDKIIKIFDFIVSLELLNDEVLNDFAEGEFISLVIDRFECDLEIDC